MKLLETAQHLRRLSGRWREPKIELRNFGSMHRPSILDGDAHVGASNLEVRVGEVSVREACGVQCTHKHAVVMGSYATSVSTNSE